MVTVAVHAVAIIFKQCKEQKRDRMLFTKQYHKTHTASWEFLHPAPKPECDGLMRSKKVGFETVQLGERGTVRCLNNFSAVSNGAAKNHAEDHANYLLKE